MLRIGERLKRLEEAKKGLEYCHCPYDFNNAIRTLTPDLGPEETERLTSHCHQCGKPLAIPVKVYVGIDLERV